MILVKIRRGVVYAATGAFFAVAAIAQLQGDDTLDAFVKAGVACLVLVVIGVLILHIVDDAAGKATEADANSGKADAAEASTAAVPAAKG